MNLSYYTVDVFTQHQFGGNPLAVFPDASDLTAEQMQLIAKELNLSETAFVVNADANSNTYDIRIFTPETELPFAGHPTVGTAYILASNNVNRAELPKNLTLNEDAGAVAITLIWSDETLQTCSFKAPKLPFPVSSQPKLRVKILANVLGIEESQIGSSPFKPAVYSGGVPFGIVPLRSREALKNISLDLGTWQRELKETPFQHLYAVCPLDNSNREWAVRMFAPAMGIMEDPATGAAATAFAGYLVESIPESTDLNAVTIHQGEEMGRPSTIFLNVARNGTQCSSVTVSGQCVLTAKATFYLQS